MSPRSLLLNGVVLVGVVTWMAGAPRLVFGSDAGATIQPTPGGPPAAKPAGSPPYSPPDSPKTNVTAPERVVVSRIGGARLVHIAAQDIATGGCATPVGYEQDAAVKDQYFIVEAQVYDRKTRRPVADKKSVGRVPNPPGGVANEQEARRAYAEREYGVWDDGKPLTEAEWRRFSR